MTPTTVLQLNLWDRIVVWYRSSLLHDLIVYFGETVYGVRFRGYENIRLPQNAEATARSLIFALMAAMLVAGAAVVGTRIGTGGFVRRLLRMDATDPSRAVTLHEAGYFRRFGIRRELSRGGALTKVVKRAGDPYTPTESEEATGIVARLNADPKKPSAPAQPTESAEPVRRSNPLPDAPEGAEADSEAEAGQAPVAPVDFLTDRFYVPEDLKIRAEMRYEKQGSTVRAYLVLVAVTLVAGALLCRVLPALFSLADLMLGGF